MKESHVVQVHREVLVKEKQEFSNNIAFVEINENVDLESLFFFQIEKQNNESLLSIKSNLTEFQTKVENQLKLIFLKLKFNKNKNNFSFHFSSNEL